MKTRQQRIKNAIKLLEKVTGKKIRLKENEKTQIGTFKFVGQIGEGEEDENIPMMSESDFTGKLYFNNKLIQIFQDSDIYDVSTVIESYLNSKFQLKDVDAISVTAAFYEFEVNGVGEVAIFSDGDWGRPA